VKTTYTRDDVEDLLAYMFNGGRWSREDAPDPDMPKAGANPSHLGGSMAEMIDMKRAWNSCYIVLRDREALYLHYGNGCTVRKVAAVLGLPVMTVQDHLVADIGDLRDEANGGRRRIARRKANLFGELLARKNWQRRHFAAMFSDVLPDDTIGVAA